MFPAPWFEHKKVLADRAKAVTRESIRSRERSGAPMKSLLKNYSALRRNLCYDQYVIS